MPAPTPLPVHLRGEPPPLHGNLWTFLKFARRNRMLTAGYALLVARWVWLKLRWRGRLVTDGVCFVCPRVKFEIGKGAKVHLGRWSWLGPGPKGRPAEGGGAIGAR